MRTGTLGLSVAARTVRAVLTTPDRIEWAGVMSWATPADLTDAIARLAGDAGRIVRRTCVVLDRDVIQTRTVAPAPPIAPAAVRRYVALEASRLFRKNGTPLVTDGVIVPVDGTLHVLWSAAVAQPVVEAILDGCRQAGISVDALGPAADLLPLAMAARATGELIFPNGGTAEVVTAGAGGTWRSRLIAASPDVPCALAPALMSLGGEAVHFAGAYAATLARPRLSLLPPDARDARERAIWRQVALIMALAALSWLLAFSIYAVRLHSSGVRAQVMLEAHAAQLDSALALRRELGAGRQSLAEFGRATAARSRHLQLLAAITNALGDSAYLVALRIGPDAVVRLAGYAPSALRVVASLERVPALRDVRLEGPVTREAVGGVGGDLDRFAIVAALERP